MTKQKGWIDTLFDSLLPSPVQSDYALAPIPARPAGVIHVATYDSTIEPCENCGQPVKTMTFKGTGMCGTICLNLVTGNWTPEQAERAAIR